MDLIQCIYRGRYFTIRKMQEEKRPQKQKEEEERENKMQNERMNDVENASTGDEHTRNMHSYTSYVVLCVRVFFLLFRRRRRRLVELRTPKPTHLQSILSSTEQFWIDSCVSSARALSFIRFLSIAPFVRFHCFHLYMLEAGSIALNETERVIAAAAAITSKKPCTVRIGIFSPKNFLYHFTQPFVIRCDGRTKHAYRALWWRTASHRCNSRFQLQ